MKATPQTITSLANQYNVCTKTMRKWLLKINIISNEKRKIYTFTPLEVEKIYEKLGNP